MMPEPLVFLHDSREIVTLVWKAIYAARTYSVNTSICYTAQMSTEKQITPDHFLEIWGLLNIVEACVMLNSRKEMHW